MRRRRRSAGITLIELLVVMAIAGVAISIAGPAMLKAIDRFSLNSSGRQLVAAFRVARGEAKIVQQEVLATLKDGEFVFYKGDSRFSSLKLPNGVQAESAEASPDYTFLPSGQILGPERLTLTLNDRRSSIVLGPEAGAVHFEEGR